MGSTVDGEPADKPVPVPTGARFPSSRQREKFADEPSGEAPARRRIRASGARFPSAKDLERYDDHETPEPQPEPAAPALETQPLDAQWPETEWSDPAPPQPRFGDDVPSEDAIGPRVRPYVLTKGRTQATHQLALETMVNVRADARWSGPALNSEYQPVRALCARPMSVAEIAAILSIPLGVARVLLSDMAELGLLHIQGTERTAEGRPPMALMRRVLAGLQRL